MLNGEVAPGFEPLARELEAQLRKQRGGAALCAYHEGEKVVDLWGGVRDESGAPWERDTPTVCYSTTKGVVSTALHLLVDAGQVAYDQPVARYWPEFGAGGKQAITVRDVMCHRAGLFNVRDLIDGARRLLDWEHMVEAIAAARPAAIPAGATAYQALTYGFIVGEVIRRVSGLPVSEFVRTRLAAPLGVDNLHIGAPEAALARAARLIGSPARLEGGARDRAIRGPGPRRRARVFRAAEWVLRALGHPVDFRRAAAALAPRGISSFDFSSDEALRACIPSANGLFDARSLAKMYAALACGGAIGGVRLLSPATLAAATEIQERGFDQITIFRMRWRLGYHQVGSLRRAPRRAFGHFGWGGSGAWADPTRRVALAYVCNTGTGSPVGDLRILRLNGALLGCLRPRAPALAAARARDH